MCVQCRNPLPNPKLSSSVRGSRAWQSPVPRLIDGCCCNWLRSLEFQHRASLFRRFFLFHESGSPLRLRGTAMSSAVPSTDEAPWPVLSQEAISMFSSGVHSCFLRWTALQLAIENEWGGRNSSQKAAQLENDILAWFVHSKAVADGVSIMLQVAEQLFILHEECSQGNYETVRSLAADSSQQKPASAKSVKAPNEDGESDSDDDIMEEDSPSGEVGGPSAQGSGSSRPAEKVSTLTEEEMADGWQEAPTRGRRRGGQRS